MGPLRSALRRGSLVTVALVLPGVENFHANKKKNREDGLRRYDGNTRERHHQRQDAFLHDYGRSGDPAGWAVPAVFCFFLRSLLRMSGTNSPSLLEPTPTKTCVMAA